MSEVEALFEENSDLGYNEFLALFEEKYGNIIESGWWNKLRRIRFAATLYIVITIIGIFPSFIYLLAQALN